MKKVTCKLDVHIDSKFQLDKAWLKQVVTTALTAGDISGAVELSLVIADDDTVRQLNQRYRGHNEPTDVLAFALNEGETFFAMPPTGTSHLGEVVISYPQAVRQAEEYHHPLEREIALLVAHGVFHLAGYEHDTPEAEIEMRTLEEKILDKLFTNH